MPEQPSVPAPSEPSAKERTKKLRTGFDWTIRIVLLAVVAVMIAALMRDRHVRRESKAAYDELEEWLYTDDLPIDGGGKTAEDVRNLVGFTPEVVQNERYTMEIYRWQRGLPWLTYDLYVVYSPEPDGRLQAITLNGPPEESELQQICIPEHFH